MDTPILIFARRITNLTDARYYAAREASFLGFNLEPGTDGFLDPVYMQAMREWVEGPAIIGEYHSPTPAEHLNEAVIFYQLDGLLIPYSDALPLIQADQIWVKMPVDSPDLAQLISNNSSYVAGWVLELPEHESSWLPYTELLQPICRQHTIVLQYDGDTQEVTSVVQHIEPAGLALRGGEEEQVGVKSFDDVESIFEELGL